jgi:AP2 domain
MMTTSRLIPLTQGKFAIVDECDYDRLVLEEWQAMNLYKGKFYAGRTEGTKPAQTTIYMAHLILPPRPGFIVDHRDYEQTLDNRRANLRYATVQQNSFNRGPNKGRRFKGVFWHAQVQKWRAMIRVNGKLICLGLYSSEEDAARAYDARAVIEFGEFVYLNFPLPQLSTQPGSLLLALDNDDDF